MYDIFLEWYNISKVYFSKKKVWNIEIYKIFMP